MRDTLLHENTKHHYIVKAVREGIHGIVSPMGTSIKNSDKKRAVVLTGIRIVDQNTLRTASEAMEKLGFPPLKARIINDVTVSGVNRAALESIEQRFALRFVILRCRMELS